uniref:Uncharacterized protein n=1 Tax=Panagrolaimus davidi TaxID=227884 RepID=A0A914PDU4_9BILA
MTKACDYCTFRQMYNSVNDTFLPNLTDRDCYVGTNPTLQYFNGGNTFTDKNDCVGTKDNEGSYKYLICDFDFCNEKCENGAVSSLNFSIFGLILSILIPLKLA